MSTVLEPRFTYLHGVIMLISEGIPSVSSVRSVRTVHCSVGMEWNERAVINARLGMQIGIKAEWRGPHGRMVLFLGNKHPGKLESVKAVILPPSNYRMQLSSFPDLIPPRAQVCRCLLSHVVWVMIRKPNKWY